MGGPPTTVSRLCEAVEHGDAATVLDLLRLRPEIVNLERPNHGELRALHIAVLRRDPAMVRLLMQHGADARRGIWPNRDATSPHRIAIERGYDEISAAIQEEELRRAGAAANPALPHRSDPDGWTPLHQAAGRLDEQAVGRLLQQGAEVNCRAKGEWTPLDFAASGHSWGDDDAPSRFPAIAKLLLRHGAQLTSISSVALGESDWVRARHKQGALGSAATLDVFGPFGGLLSTAVKHDRPDMMSLLLSLGLDPDERVRIEGSEEVGYSWGNPLHLCASSGKFAMAEMLLNHGADPNGQVCTSGSPVYAAYCRNDRSMIELLERHGGTLDAASVGYLRQTDLARRMLAGEVDPRLEFGKFSGSTVAEQLLWSGASGGDPEIVRMALERIDWPREDPRWFWMLWRPLPGHSTRSEADRPLFLACFRRILERCDPNLRDEKFGQTMLHEVIARDHEEGVAFATLLLDAGARMDVRDNLLNSTPLGWACRWGRTDLVQFLLARGADSIEPAAEPWATPRAWAEKMGHTAVLALLPGGPAPG
jgi:ankyrin repeat protein